MKTEPGLSDRARTSIRCVPSMCAALIAVLAAGGPVNAQQQALGSPAAPKAPAPVVAAAPQGAVGGLGDINLYPKRVVMGDKLRVTSVGLYNRASASGDYEISISDLVMKPDGTLVELATIKDEAERAKVRTASALIRWSPHRVTLPANEAQMIRVMAHAGPDLPPGEYHSHFSVVAVPPVSDGLSIEQAAGATQPGNIGVTIVPRFGIAIPVIVRVGQTTLTAGLRDLAVTTSRAGAKVVSLTITRAGTRSAFGDVTVTVPGAKKPVAQVRGIGVYTEIAERRIEIPLTPDADPRLIAPGARLTVTYVDDDEAPGKTLARQEFVVP